MAGPLHKLRPFLDGEYVGVGQLKVVDPDLSDSQMCEASHSPRPVLLLPALPFCPGEGQYQLFHTVPAKGGASCLAPTLPDPIFPHCPGGKGASSPALKSSTMPK